jgi:CheY-like chemotaxis protein
MGRANDHPTILIVDDVPDLVKVLTRRLEHWGYRMLTAMSREDGLTLAEVEQPDRILLDILLPGLDGHQVCARLKANPTTTDIPAVFLTCLGSSDHVQRGVACGAEDDVVKPFESVNLRERIQRCLQQDDQTPS